MIGCGSGSWQCASTGTSLPSDRGRLAQKVAESRHEARARHREVEQEVGAVRAASTRYPATMDPTAVRAASAIARGARSR